MSVFRYFVREYPGQSLVVLVCLLLGGAMEGVGIASLLPVLALVTPAAHDAAEAHEPSSLGGLIDGLLTKLGVTPSIGELLAFLVLVFWLKAIVILFANRQVGYMVARVATDLRLALLRALMIARWSHYTRLPAGSAANAVATEADRASLTYLHVSQTVGYAIEAALYLALALSISWQVTLGAAATAVATLGALGFLVRMASRAGRKQTKYLKLLLSRVTDSLQAIKLLKATGREGLIEPLLERDTLRLNTALRRRIFSKEALRALQEPIAFSAGGAGIFLGIVVLQIPLGETMLLTGLFLQTISCSNKMNRKYQAAMMESSALWSMRDMIERADSDVEQMPGGATPSLERGIELRGVRVRLDGVAVIDDLNLMIPAGQVTALIGESGSGKTTTADAVVGLVRPEAGEITVDGVPLDELDLRKWRHLIGYVPQEMLMLHDSVAQNVSLGDPEITAQDIENALRDAGAWEFVSALSEGVESTVGERGSLLSGGQRQRIALARALVHGAKLLILDEATAALDPENEAAVWATIQRLRGRTTVLAISHQPVLSTVADGIYRIENGRATPVKLPARTPRQATV